MASCLAFPMGAHSAGEHPSLADFARSPDMTRVLPFVPSDRNPGETFLLDTGKRSITPIGTRMAWDDAAAMASYPSVPDSAGRACAAGLPLVVMPHGGPWARDARGFDPFVRALASLGPGLE